MRLIVIAPVDPARNNDAYRCAFVAHGPNLHGRRMGSQDVAGVQVERVVKRPRRVVLGNIQRREVVIIVLDFRSAAHPEPGCAKDIDNPPQRTGYRMQPAHRLAAARQRDVDPVGEFCLDLHRLEPFPASSDLVNDGLLDAIDLATGGGPFFDRQLAETLEFGSNQALAAEVPDAHRIQLRQIVRRSDGSLRLFKQSGRAGHGECREVVRVGQDASASLAAFAMAPNASGSWTAISARTLRSTWISARLRPLMSRL